MTSTARRPDVDHSPRVVRLAGSHNVRDLGGLPAAGGRTRFGRIFRGDFPVSWTRGGGAAETGLPVQSVVDLRRGSEDAHEGIDPAALGLRYQRVTLVTDQGSSWTSGYDDYLRDGPQEIVRAVAAVMEGADDGVYFHCAAGKDRTGVVAALVLELLGVDRDVIVDDYLLTAGAVPSILERLRVLPGYAQILAGRTVENHLPRAEKMVGLFAELDRHGGAEGWLTANGMAAESIAAFRDLMIESR